MNNKNQSALWSAELAFQEIENGKDVYVVKKSKGYGTGWSYLDTGKYVSRTIICNLIRVFDKVVVLDKDGIIVAKNYL